MSFAPVPATAAWRHQGARSGFEVVYFRHHTRAGSGWITLADPEGNEFCILSRQPAATGPAN